MQLEVVKKNLTFSEALEALKQFAMIKCPEWEGFWFIDQGQIKVMNPNAIVTCKPSFEHSVLREDWQIVDYADLYEDDDDDCNGCELCFGFPEFDLIDNDIKLNGNTDTKVSPSIEVTDNKNDLKPKLNVVYVSEKVNELEAILKKFGITPQKIWVD